MDEFVSKIACWVVRTDKCLRLVPQLEDVHVLVEGFDSPCEKVEVYDPSQHGARISRLYRGAHTCDAEPWTWEAFIQDAGE